MPDFNLNSTANVAATSGAQSSFLFAGGRPQAGSGGRRAFSAARSARPRPPPKASPGRVMARLHNEAFAHSLELAGKHSHRCARCMTYNCDTCWNSDKGLCRDGRQEARRTTGRDPRTSVHLPAVWRRDRRREVLPAMRRQAFHEVQLPQMFGRDFIGRPFLFRVRGKTGLTLSRATGGSSC